MDVNIIGGMEGMSGYFGCSNHWRDGDKGYDTDCDRSYNWRGGVIGEGIIEKSWITWHVAVK